MRISLHLALWLTWLLAEVSGSVAQAADYVLGPGDMIHITVFDHPELELEARITQSGNISYPLLGVIQVGGLTAYNAEALIARKLIEGSFIRQPQVTINVGEFQSQKVGVIGQVNKPGQFPLSSSQKLLEVLAMAGGVVSDTAADLATLIRADGSVQTIDLHRLLAGEPNMNIEIHNGDTLSIPRAAQFYVYGEVQKPGVYRLNHNMTVSQGISASGGLTKTGTESGVKIKRRMPDGTEKTFKVSSAQLLQADDVVMIKERWF